MSAQAKPRVAVVFGGRSEEHGISCVTAGSVLQALDPARYDVVPIGISRNGDWVLVEGGLDQLRISDDGDLPQISQGKSVALVQSEGGTNLTIAQPHQPPSVLGHVDVVLPLLHGPWGEDGTIQGLLELAGVRYVGAGVLASAVGMDKHYMKVVFAGSGLPVLPHVLVTTKAWRHDPDSIREAVSSLGFPVFVKPCRGGSSFGISKVHILDHLDAAIDSAAEHDPRVLVEASAPVGSREIECGVIGGASGAPASASVPGEITVGGDHEFYDFEAKYLDDSATLVVPADLPPEVEERVRDLAVRAFDALDCDGLARADFFVRSDGTVVINEVNTMPGFTSISLFPRMWEATGVSYRNLVDRLVSDALRKGTGLH